MQTTSKLGLNQPGLDDHVDISVLNKNMFVLDNSIVSTEQTLSEAEKQQVQKNIGIINTNENLFDNWYFLDPINQRGDTSWSVTSKKTYTIDRWCSFGGILSWSSSGFSVNVKAGQTENNITQYIERDLKGKTCTISAQIGGVIYSYTDTMPSVNGSYVTSPEMGGFEFTLGVGSAGYCIGRFTPVGGGVIEKVKLELGEYCTLENDAPPDKATQMVKCQRYFQKIDAGRVVGMTNSTTQLMWTYFLPVEMRDAPTLYSTPGNIPWVRGAGAQKNLTETKYSILFPNKSRVVLQMDVKGATLAIYSAYMIPLGVFCFSADL